MVGVGGGCWESAGSSQEAQLWSRSKRSMARASNPWPQNASAPRAPKQPPNSPLEDEILRGEVAWWSSFHETTTEPPRKHHESTTTTTTYGFHVFLRQERQGPVEPDGDSRLVDRDEDMVVTWHGMGSDKEDDVQGVFPLLSRAGWHGLSSNSGFTHLQSE